jgi:hypothetical protein
VRSGRQFVRVEAEVPVHLAGGGEATTRDLSPGGVYFVTEKEMVRGNSIRFTVEFENPGGTLYLDCVGEIVRIEEAGGKVGIAAKILESRLERKQAIHKQGAHG